jgi:transposase InsO family protein
MKVSVSGYYKWFNKVPSVREKHNEYLVNEIHQVYRSSKRRYGSPRITKELKMRGIRASQPLVAKLMRREHIQSIIRKKFKATTDSSHNYPIVENKLRREFTVKESNRVWVSDLTYVHTAQGWVYLTTVIDLFDRKVIGWALSETMKTKATVIPAFRMAKLNRPLQTEQKLIFHSDRGIQYACEEFVNEISKHENIERSMSRKGNCWDNAVAESFFKTLKVELIYQNKYETRKEAELSIFEYIEVWYNQNRRHKQLNNLTITEFQKSITNHLKNVA